MSKVFRGRFAVAGFALLAALLVVVPSATASGTRVFLVRAPYPASSSTSLSTYQAGWVTTTSNWSTSPYFSSKTGVGGMAMSASILSVQKNHSSIYNSGPQLKGYLKLSNVN